MSRRSVWILEGLVTAAVIAGIVCTANFRYARPLVDPAPPTPDYVLQPTLAYSGIAIVAIVAAILTILITRHPSPRRASAIWVAVAIVGTGLTAVIAAFVTAAQ